MSGACLQSMTVHEITKKSWLPHLLLCSAPTASMRCRKTIIETSTMQNGLPLTHSII
jgi:hypothetical protein